MKKFKFKINNLGFTLMEVMIAMALVTVVATFAASALLANGKNLSKTQEISKGGDSSLSECERYLANESDHGKTEGDLQLKKISGGMSGFPDIKLEIKDSSDTVNSANEANVKYVAFKRLGDENDVVGGGGVSASGGGLTSGSDGSVSGGTDGGTDGGAGVIDEEPQTEPPTTARVTEALTAAPVTEAQPEATTKSQPFNGGISGANLKDYIGKNNNTALDGEIKSADGISVKVGWSNINGVTDSGFIKLGSGQCINFSQLAMKDGKNYKTILCFESSDGSIPKIKWNGQVKEAKEYEIDATGYGWWQFFNDSGCEIYLTGIRFEEIVETTTTTTTTVKPTTTTTTTTTTEAATETTTKAVSGQVTPSSAAGVGLSSSDLKNCSACSWDSGYILGGEALRNANGTTVQINWSLVSDVTSQGIVLKNGKKLTIGSVHDDSWNCDYEITVTLATSDGSVPNCTIGGVQVSGNTYTLPAGKNGFDIESGSSEVIITGIYAVKR